MNNYFVILAAGKSTRFDKKRVKQFYIYKNKEIIDHSIEKSLQSKLFKKIIVVTNNINKLKNNKYIKFIKVIKGGKERSDSSLSALKYLKKYKPKNVFIHDAARPNFSNKLLKNIIKNLKNNEAVIPIVASKDSIKYKIKFISGENQNNKITYLDDVKTSKTYFGIGFDLHKLIKNKKLYLGGVKIPFHSGLKGHSDGDVILHAIIDAILGAIRKKDIGTYFPNTKKFKNIRSPKLLKPIMDKLNKLNFSINNLDINLICEQPKVSKYRGKITNSISKLIDLNKDQINLKGKTVEKLGLIGKEKAIACEVIVSITKYD
ncbi:2-C-methyl-D-erythritol 2,4-cyclodiphosphate synthase [Pelagibacterales bacterium SAG-MED07]|nr:2-C-methyl-D-erythritol 2,4-cyclodiphosphate synthase [Pelagibacterales bacterium SAG-MED07]